MQKTGYTITRTSATVVKQEAGAVAAVRKSWVLNDGVGGSAAFNKGIILNSEEQFYVDNFVAASTGFGYSSLKYDKALSTDALRELSMRLGNVEVAQIFVKQKYGGYYSILQGSESRIEVSKYLHGTPYLISHVHPSGNPFPSEADKDLLSKIQALQISNGVPAQKSSQIVPLGQSNQKFNKSTQTVGQ